MKNPPGWCMLSLWMIKLGACVPACVFEGTVGTHLSLWFQVGFVSYEDHGELVSVFDSEDLPLEFVDFFKTVKHVTLYSTVYCFTLWRKTHNWVLGLLTQQWERKDGKSHRYRNIHLFLSDFSLLTIVPLLYKCHVSFSDKKNNFFRKKKDQFERETKTTKARTAFQTWANRLHSKSGKTWLI